jgi:hypothetical protein
MSIRKDSGFIRRAERKMVDNIRPDAVLIVGVRKKSDVQYLKSIASLEHVA